MPGEPGVRDAAPAAGMHPAPVAVLGGHDGRVAFWGVMFFTFVLFVAPQFIFPVLQPLRLALLSAVFAIVAWALDRLLRRQPLIEMGPVERLLLCFMALAVASVPFSLWPGGSVDVLVNQLVKSVLVFVLLANILNTMRRVKLLIWSMVLWSSLMAVIAVRDFATGNLELQGLRIAGYDSPLTNNPNDLALTLNLVLALAIGLCRATREAWLKLLLVAAMGVMTAGVVASFSRGGFLTLVTIALVSLVKETRRRGGAMVALAVPVVLVALFFLFPQGYGDRLHGIVDPQYDPTGSSTSRWEGLVLAFRLVLERPLLGLGLGQHGLKFVENGLGWTGVHNVFLEIGADLGVPALVVYLLILRQVFVAARWCQRQADGAPGAIEQRALAGGVETGLWGYVTGALFHPVPYHFYFFYLAGFAMALQSMAKRTSATRGTAPTGGRSATRWWERAPAVPAPSGSEVRDA